MKNLKTLVAGAALLAAGYTARDHTQDPVRELLENQAEIRVDLDQLRARVAMHEQLLASLTHKVKEDILFQAKVNASITSVAIEMIDETDPFKLKGKNRRERLRWMLKQKGYIEAYEGVVEALIPSLDSEYRKQSLPPIDQKDVKKHWRQLKLALNAFHEETVKMPKQGK